MPILINNVPSDCVMQHNGEDLDKALLNGNGELWARERIVYENTYSADAGGTVLTAGIPTINDAEYITTSIMGKSRIDVTAGNSINYSELLFTLSNLAQRFKNAEVTIAYAVSAGYGKSALYFNNETVYAIADYGSGSSGIQEKIFNMDLESILSGSAKYEANNRSSSSGVHCYIAFVITKIVLK